MRLGRTSVAACPPDFLIIGFQAARQIRVEYISDIRLVDAHAKRDGRHHHDASFGHEALLVGVARLLGHAGVIRQRPHLVLPKKRGHLFGLLARQAVHNAAAPWMPLHEIEQLALAVVARFDTELDVRSVETQHQRFHPATEQPHSDVDARRFVGGSGQSNDRHIRENITQPRQGLIFTAKGRAPLRNAMRLVHGNQPDIETAKGVEHSFRHQPLGREIKQPCLARHDTPPCGNILIAVYRGIDRVRCYPGQPQRRDLVMHQRHQWRDDDGKPTQDERRDLITQRFSRAGRHHRQRVAPGQQRRHYRLLAGTKVLEAEHVLQHKPHGAWIGCLDHWRVTRHTEHSASQIGDSRR